MKWGIECKDSYHPQIVINFPVAELLRGESQADQVRGLGISQGGLQVAAKIQQAVRGSRLEP